MRSRNDQARGARGSKQGLRSRPTPIIETTSTPNTNNSPLSAHGRLGAALCAVFPATKNRSHGTSGRFRLHVTLLSKVMKILSTLGITWLELC